MDRLQRNHHQPSDSTHQVSRRGRGFVPRMGLASDSPTCGLSIVTQAHSGHSSRTDSEELFKSPTPMGSESTCDTSSPSPRTRKSNSSGAGSDTRGEGESLAASTPERGHRISISRDSDMCSSESTSDTSPSFPGDNHNERSSDEEPWTWFDSPTRNGRTRDQRRKISFKIIVVFRGGWCDTSRTLLKGFSELNQTVSRSGGKLVAVSSQTQEQVAKAVREHKLTFQAFADPTNELIRKMNRRFNIRCTISTNDMVLGAYPNGMAQPCVFAVMTDESPDERSVLYKWERWQTIASLRHESALKQIQQAIARRTNPPQGPSLGVPAPAPQPPLSSNIALQRPPTGRSKRRPSSMSVVNRLPYINSTPKYKSAGYSESISNRVSGYSAGRAPPSAGPTSSTLEQPETPRGRRSFSMATASSPRASSPSPSVESHRGGRTLSIDDVVDDAIKRGSWTKTPPHAGQRAPRDGNASSRRERHIQFRFSSGGSGAAEVEPSSATATVTAAEPSSAEDRSGKVSRDLKDYGGALGAPSGRPLLRIREATQTRGFSTSRWDEPDGSSPFGERDEGRDVSVSAAVQRARRPIPPIFSPVVPPEDFDATTEAGGESETKETVAPPTPSQQQQRWMGFGRSSVGNGDSRRPPTPRRHQQQQEAKKPVSRLSWSGVRKERHQAASGFGSGSRGGVITGNGNARDGFGVHEDRKGCFSSGGYVVPASEVGERLFATRSGEKAREQPPPENGELPDDQQGQWSSSGDESSWGGRVYKT